MTVPLSQLLVTGDCVETMKTLPDASIDAVVCDPPYELAFMGKSWDASGVAFRPETWREVLRVLKPGGYLLAFSGTRTYHRMTVAIEDAGFEIRDCLSYQYGSGFPKSHDVSKAIDKALGVEPLAHVPASGVGMMTRASGTGGRSHKREDGGWNETKVRLVMPPATTEAAQKWKGWGTALKPAWEPIVVARRPLEGTVAGNVLKYGTGAMNIDGCRVPHGGDVDMDAVQRQQNSGGVIEGAFGAAALVGKEIATYKEGGRWPANLILSHAPGCQQTGTREEAGYSINRFTDGAKPFGGGAGHPYESTKVPPSTVPVWTCAEGCPCAALDAQSGVSKSSGGRAVDQFRDRNPVYGGGRGLEEARDPGFGDTGGASRYFNQLLIEADDLVPFFYTAKASRKERNAGLPEGATCTHPCVKPVSVMRHLVRLVTRKGGVVLDPFMGSGTTGIAAVLEGINFIGIDLSEEYVEIAKARIAHAGGTPEAA
jgi:hypothetical protein